MLGVEGVTTILEVGYNFDYAGAAAASEFADLVSKRIAPTADWSGMSRAEHFVQFYESDEYIVDSVAEYVIHGLKSDETCILAATPDHLSAIEATINAFGIDVEEASAAGNYILLDAQETLDKFMVGGMPDAELFDAVIGRTVAKASRRGGVRIFGEMVAVLLAAGQPDASLALEELWNGLHEQHEFSLFCAYPVTGISGPRADRFMTRICCSHTKVIPGESYTALTTADERLRAIALLQQRGKQLEAQLAELEAKTAAKGPRAAE